MASLAFTEELVVCFDTESHTVEEVERMLARTLRAAGYVREGFEQAVVERELAYPTALEMGGINVAIPHCDPCHVERGALCVGVLPAPVAWPRMDAPNATTPVSLVVMLALNEAGEHLEMLGRVIDLMQDQELVARIVAAESRARVFDLLSRHLSA